MPNTPFVRELQIETRGQGLYEFTSALRESVQDSGVDGGLCTIFVRHTSASLVIQENADPDVQRDLQAFMSRLAPEGDRLYTHTSEGPDDMPAHVRSALTQTSIGIPISRGEVVLGTWQGVYLWEHRSASHRRRIVVHIA